MTLRCFFCLFVCLFFLESKFVLVIGLANDPLTLSHWYLSLLLENK